MKIDKRLNLDRLQEKIELSIDQTIENYIFDNHYYDDVVVNKYEIINHMISKILFNNMRIDL